jgi:hypothetical protein
MKIVENSDGKVIKIICETKRRCQNKEILPKHRAVFRIIHENYETMEHS